MTLEQLILDLSLPDLSEKGNYDMMKELDIVVLTHDIPEHNLLKGSRGAVVHCYDDEQAFEVEFVSDSEETSVLLTLEKADIQLAIEAAQSEVLDILADLPEDMIAEVRDFAEFLHQKQQRKTAS